MGNNVTAVNCRDGKPIHKRNGMFSRTQCGQCRRDLEPGEPIWWARYAVRAFTIRTGRLCVACMGNSNLAVWLPKPCEVCGRQYHRKRWQPGQHVLCSPPCKSAFYRRNKLAAAKLARNKTCTECGQPFEATRADARTCSNACKQSAYRKRVRDEIERER